VRRSSTDTHICICACAGFKLPDVPTGPTVVADFDHDGYNDIIIQVCDKICVGGNQCVSRRMPHTATRCNTLQHSATHCNTLQHTAAHCNTLQHTALQHTATHLFVGSIEGSSRVMSRTGLLVHGCVGGCACACVGMCVREG